MKPLTKKFKIYNQTHENIHDISLTTKLKTKKWNFLEKFHSVKPTSLIKPVTLKYLYKVRLNERQKFKKFYGYLSDRKLKTLYTKIKNKNTSFLINNLTVLLECRLNMILWRTSLFSSIFKIHQNINHGLIKINTKVNREHNFIVRPGDIITISPKIIDFDNTDQILPLYLEWNKYINTLTVIRNPELIDIQYSFNTNPTLIFDYLNNK